MEFFRGCLVSALCAEQDQILGLNFMDFILFTSAKMKPGSGRYTISGAGLS